MLHSKDPVQMIFSAISESCKLLGDLPWWQLLLAFMAILLIQVVIKVQRVRRDILRLSRRAVINTVAEYRKLVADSLANS